MAQVHLQNRNESTSLLSEFKHCTDCDCASLTHAHVRAFVRPKAAYFVRSGRLGDEATAMEVNQKTR